jgi:isocitrate/isopropylmalate dehydrogenase
MHCRQSSALAGLGEESTASVGLAGSDIANPGGLLLSAVMMLDHVRPPVVRSAQGHSPTH